MRKNLKKRPPNLIAAINAFNVQYPEQQQKMAQALLWARLIYNALLAIHGRPEENTKGFQQHHAKLQKITATLTKILNIDRWQLLSGLHNLDAKNTQPLISLAFSKPKFYAILSINYLFQLDKALFGEAAFSYPTPLKDIFTPDNKGIRPISHLCTLLIIRFHSSKNKSQCLLCKQALDILTPQLTVEELQKFTRINQEQRQQSQQSYDRNLCMSEQRS